MSHVRCLSVIAIVLVSFLSAQDPDARSTSSPRVVTEEGLADAIAIIEEVVADGDPIGGELLVLQHGKPVLHRAFGLSDDEADRPWKKGSICRIRSMTKPIVATGIWMLIEEGRLALDTPVQEHLPAFDNERSGGITVKHLLTHTAGFGHPGYAIPMERCQELATAVDATAGHGPEVAPGERYRYSDMSSATLARLVTVVSGQPVERFLTERVFEPLGMTSTVCRFDRDDPRASRHASTYIRTPEGIRRYWSPEQDQRLPYFRGSGGIYSTPEDYGRFLRMWAQGGMHGAHRMLKEETVRQALASTPLSRNERYTKHYGHHFELIGPVRTAEELKGARWPDFGHSGSDGTVAFHLVKEDVTLLWFTQTRRGEGFRKVVRSLFRALRDGPPLGVPEKR